MDAFLALVNAPFASLGQLGTFQRPLQRRGRIGIQRLAGLGAIERHHANTLVDLNGDHAQGDAGRSRRRTDKQVTHPSNFMNSSMSTSTNV